jgi:predicted DNA-binding ribbon-helix-helix protein
VTANPLSLPPSRVLLPDLGCSQRGWIIQTTRGPQKTTTVLENHYWIGIEEIALTHGVTVRELLQETRALSTKRQHSRYLRWLVTAFYRSRPMHHSVSTTAGGDITPDPSIRMPPPSTDEQF